MKKLLDNRELFLDALLPNCFFGVSFVMVIITLIYLIMGIESNIVVTYASCAINGVFFLVYFFEISKNIGAYKELWKVVICLWGFLVLSYIYFFLKNGYGLNSKFAREAVIMGIVTLNSSFSMMYCVKNDKYKEIIKKFDYYGIVILVFSIIYIIRLFYFHSQEARNFGRFSYMGIAYLNLTVLMLFVFKLIYFEEENKKRRVWRLISILIYWLTIIYSMTRGAILSVVAFLLFMYIFDLTINKGKRIPIIITISAIFTVCYVFSVNALVPTDPGKLKNFNYDSTNFEEEMEDSDILLIRMDYIIKMDQNINKSLHQLSKNRNLEGRKIYAGKNIKQEKFFEEYELPVSRRLLYKFAVEEWRKNPWFGNGVMYYKTKYNGYPHNIILEILCDFGIFGLLVFTCFVLWLFISNIKSLRNNKAFAGVSLVCLGGVCKYMVSDSFYEGGALFLLIVLTLCNSIYTRRIESEK